jgi:antitoxin CcdA
MPTRKAVNVTMDAELLAKAKAEGLNVSAELDERVRSRLSSIEEDRWKRDNAEAIAAMNERIEAEGVAGEEHRIYG